MTGVARVATADTSSAGARSTRASTSASASGRPTPTRSALPDAYGVVLTRNPKSTWPSAAGSTAASVRTWPAWSCGSHLREWHRRIPDYSIVPGTELNYMFGLRQVDKLPLVFGAGERPRGRAEWTSRSPKTNSCSGRRPASSWRPPLRPRRSGDWPTSSRLDIGRPGGSRAPSSVGRRCWCPRNTGAAACRATACSTWPWWPRRWGGRCRPAPSSRPTWWPRPWADSGTGAHVSEVPAPPARRHLDRRLVPRPHRPPASTRGGQPGRRRGSDGRPLVLDGASVPIEAAGQADWLLVTALADGRAVPVPRRRRRRRGEHRPRPTASTSYGGSRRSRFDGVAVDDEARGPTGGGGRRRRAPVRAGRRPPVRGDGGGDRPGPRLHARVRLRPLLVRPPPRLLPGPQAPLRRHEAVARGSATPRPTPPPGPSTRPPPAPPSWSAWPSRTSATGRRRSCRTASSCTAASGSPGTTTSTSTSGGWS